MRRHVLMMLAVLTTAGMPAAHAAESDDVDKSIARGVAFLYSRFSPDKAWEKVAAADPKARREFITGGQWGGPTALATLTLLAAGENPSDPRLARAIDFLRHADLKGNYATSIRAEVWPCLPMTPQNKQAVRNDGDLLVSNVKTTGPGAGFYGYWVPDKEPWYDHSNSQLAVLGVWASAETDLVEVPASYWDLVDRAWKSHQRADGGWSYQNDHMGPLPSPSWDQETFSMTAAGVATLLITQDYLRWGTDCHGNWDNANIEAGIKWMIAHLKDAFGTYDLLEFHPRGIKYYGLYGLERVGQASGRKYLGTLDWFKAASDRLIAEQGADGGWYDGDNLSTCLALLVLIHGRAPVALNKLEYNLNMHGDTPKPANWNERPRDAARFVHWLGHAEELEYGWQIVNLQVPADDLHDAPILYIAGNQAIDFTDDELAKLKQFCEEGGLILFNADCASKMFTNAVQSLGAKLFPSAEFRELPADHPIYTNEQFRRDHWKQKPGILGLSNGARELMILVPQDDLGRFWQTGAYGGREAFHDVAGDIFQYMVTNPQLLKKGSTFIVRPHGAGGGPAIKVARLQYAGNWDPEPGGWRRLAAILHNQAGAELTVQTVQLGDGKLAGYKVAHLTGTYSTRLTDPQRSELKQFVLGGGTLVIDSCGGSAAFAGSIEDELAAIFDLKAPLPIIKPDHAPYSIGSKITRVEYRPYAMKTLGKLDAPRLRGLEINGRLAVIFSPEDLSTGLVGVPVDGIYGYEPRSAVSLMTNILLLASTGGNSVPPRAASRP